MEPLESLRSLSRSPSDGVVATRTDTFAAAGARLTDMVSMYSLVYENSVGTNQAIFESSQGRFKGGYRTTGMPATGR